MNSTLTYSTAGISLPVHYPMKLGLLVLMPNLILISQCKDNICRAKLNQRLLRDSTPYQKILTAKSLAVLNETIRRDHFQGHLLNRIVVPCKQDGSTERCELISKICDDAINEYMEATNHDDKLLEINLECGGDLPPRAKISGIRAEGTMKYGSDKEDSQDINQEAQIYRTKHPFQHLSTCSPAVPYPSANTFGRCSIEDYVKLLKERRKIQKQQ
uniref:Uncharacterized protein n=1 Tax=Setaria digitata TaxID=48799 RepID=A0A915Q2B3_9BILA